MKEFFRSRFCRGVLGFTTATLLIVAFVHTEIAKKLSLSPDVLAWIGVACPASLATSAQVDELRQEVLSDLRGKEKAPSYPALDWSLNRANEKGLLRQLRMKQFDCEGKIKSYRVIECKRVPAKNENIIADKLIFVMDEDQKLMAVEVFYRQLSSQYAIRHLQKVFTALKKQLGKPSYQMGSWTPDYFRKEMNSSILEYKYQDYLAKVTATRLPKKGVAIYEQYLLLR